MKTDELIDLLGTNVERVDRYFVPRALAAAVGVGAFLSLAVMLLVFGLRSDAVTVNAFIFLVLKLAFTIIVAVLATVMLIKVARPGGERRVPLIWLAIPFALIVLLALGSLALAPSMHWDRMILGDRWLECLLSIPIIAIVPFAAVIWALRQMAPTDLVRAGALGGLLAGAISATGYALHCMDDTLPFVALWYGGTIAACTLAGALLGPRLLRW